MDGPLARTGGLGAYRASRLSTEPPAATQNVWRVPVQQTVFQGDFTQVHVGWGDQHLVARCAAMEPIASGSEVFISIDPRRVVLLSR